jgi:hypothetical protein
MTFNIQVRSLREAMRNRTEKEILSLQQIAEQELRQALLTGEALSVLHSKQNRFSIEHKKRFSKLLNPKRIFPREIHNILSHFIRSLPFVKKKQILLQEYHEVLGLILNPFF